MTRYIAHLDFPDFYAALEELRQPELKKRPFVLAKQGPRSVVQGVNAVGRQEGIREGMPLGLARRFCRRLYIVSPDFHFYEAQHHHILKELDHFSPLVEGTVPGRYFVDLTGTQRLWGASPDAAYHMERQMVTRNGLNVRVGLAANKLISQVAANCIPPGDLTCIFPGSEASFLAPLPITFLPGVGTKTTSRLGDFNIQHIGQLSTISAEMLAGVFGRAAYRLLRLARGIDSTPVVPFERIPRLCVAHTLDRDEIDRERLETILLQQAAEVGWILRNHNRYPGKFAIEIRYADGVAARNQHQLSPVTICVDRRLFQVIVSAFNRLVQRRIAIRRVVLEFFEFSMPLRQMSLFPWEEVSIHKDLKLQKALDDIRDRFGRKVIFWGYA